MHLHRTASHDSTAGARLAGSVTVMTYWASHPLVVRVDGVLDVPAARRLVEWLAGAGDAEVHVDLTQVREFHDFGVVILARALEERAKTSVLGLRQHHVRLLRYLGIDAGAENQSSPAELP
jgi:anti-anti-sigma regulatory factor